MASPHDWNLEMNASQQPFDYDKPNSKLSWGDFSTFYKTANDWDYPVENTDKNNASQSDTKTNHEDMFINHGSRNSMDILADDMNTKWSYNINNNSNENINNDNVNNSNVDNNNNNNHHHLLPNEPTCWQNTLSNTAQASITAAEQMENFLDDEEADDHEHEHDASQLQKNPSITDSQGIDNDTQIIVNEIASQIKKDKEIETLKDHISKLHKENKTLIEENEQLKRRNGELRKTLHKAQQYRRKSSIAVQNLININNKISNLQDNQDNNNTQLLSDCRNEEKVREEEELNNFKIQQQIQQAIAMFQEEFGAELDDELNNIESFQYDSLPEDSPSEDNNKYHFDERNINDPLYHGTQPQKQINNHLNFAIKFTDAHSNKNENNNNEYIDDDNDTDDALPDSFYTPGGPSNYVTPGGPDVDNENRYVMTINATANDSKLKEMEVRLNDLGEKMLGLMGRIQDLTDRNQHLEVSKLELITNTSVAMNEYRDTIKGLNRQNQMLRAKNKII